MSYMNYTRGFDEGEHDNSCFQLIRILDNDIREIFVNVYGEDAEYLNNVFTQRDKLRKALEEITISARDLSDHEVCDGAPILRWSDMRESLVKAERIIEQALPPPEGKEEVCEHTETIRDMDGNYACTKCDKIITVKDDKDKGGVKCTLV